MSEDFGEGYGKVPQDVLNYFHELEEQEYMKVLAIKMTPTHCKGVVCDLPEEEALKGIEAGLFHQDLPSAIDALINGPEQEQQETYHADGSDKVYITPIDPATSTIIKPKKK